MAEMVASPACSTCCCCWSTCRDAIAKRACYGKAVSDTLMTERGMMLGVLQLLLLLLLLVYLQRCNEHREHALARQ